MTPPRISPMVRSRCFSSWQGAQRYMELLDGTLKIDHFLTVTLGIVVLFVGKRLNQIAELMLLPALHWKSRGALNKSRCAGDVVYRMRASFWFH